MPMITVTSPYFLMNKQNVIGTNDSQGTLHGRNNLYIMDVSPYPYIMQSGLTSQSYEEWAN